MRRTIFSGLFLLCISALLSVGTTAQTNGWKNYSNTAGNFKVLFPDAPADAVNDTKGDNTLDSHTLVSRQGEYIYTVVYVHMTEAQTVNDASYAKYKEGVLHDLPCKVEAEQPPAPAVAGYIGHLYRLSCTFQTNMIMKGNLYWGKHYGYAVMVYSRSTANPSLSESKFLNSFQLMDPGK